MKFLPVALFSTGAWLAACALSLVLRGSCFAQGDAAQHPSDLSAHGASSGEKPVGPEVNLLQDATLEKRTGHWVFRTYGKKDVIAQDENQPHNGHASMKIDQTGAADAAEYVQRVDVKPDTRYRLSGWIKTANLVLAEDEKPGNVNAGACLAAAGTRDRTRVVPATTDWTYVTVDLSSGQKTNLTVGPKYGGHVTGTAWFADISLVELGPGPVARNSPPPAKPPPPDPAPTSPTSSTSPSLPPRSGPVLFPDTQPGFVAIFDKNHTDGWKYIGEGEMAVRDGVASTSAQKPPQDGLYWYQKTSFADFTLKVELRTDSTTANSGVFIRFPDPGNDYRVATEKGYEIDIYGKNTGSIIFHPPGASATTIRPTGIVPLLLGAWNEFEITASGQKLTVILNGQVVNECAGNGFLNGYIGLQTNVGDGPVHFRNVRIKENTSHEVVAQNPAEAPWQNASWVGDVSLPAGTYQAKGKKIEITKGRKIKVSPACLVEGGTFTAAGGAVWEVRESVFWGTHFEDNLGAKFYATSSLFDNVDMNKTGGWFVDRWSTRWTFENCVFAGKFTRSELGVTDYSIRADRCTFRNLTLPKLKYKKDPADEAQSNDLKFSNCHFIRCAVPETFLASTVDCVFDECDFSGKPADWTKAGRPILVTAYILGPGTPPKSYENGNLKVTFKTTTPPENGSTLAYTFTNNYLSLPTIHDQGKVLALGTIDNKSPSTTTPPLSKPGNKPASSATPAPPAPASTPGLEAPAAELVKADRNSLVFVTGANGAGCGFLANYATGSFLFTDAHVAAGTKGAGFKTLDGAELKIGAASCAVGHDVFLLQATTSGKPLEMMKGVDENASVGDQVVVLGNSAGGGVVSPITGKIVSIGPQLIEVDAPFQPGYSGSPIIHLKSGKVIGVAAYTVTHPDDSATKKPAKDPVVRRFGCRLDSIKSWQPVNWPAFSAQAAEMEAIEKLTADLAAFLGDLANNSHAPLGTHNNPVIKNRIESWLEDRARQASSRDADAADQSLSSFLKTTCQSDVTAARQHLTYDYFQRNLADQQKERDEIAKGFDEIIQNLRKEK